MNPASKFKRLLAFFIDCFIIAIPLSIYNYIVILRSVEITESSKLSTEILSEKLMSPNISIIVAITGMLYYMVFECSKWQASIGKRLFNLCVVTKENNTIKLWQSCLRSVIWHLSALTTNIILLLGFKLNLTMSAAFSLSYGLACFIPIFFTENRLTLYDTLTSTKVCYKPNKKALK